MLRSHLAGLLLSVALPALAVAQLPSPALDYIFPPGGQAGSKLTVEVSGRDLDDAQQLVFSHPGLVGTPVMRAAGEFEQQPQQVTNQFEIEIPVNIPPGNYDVRVVGRFGVSTPRTFCVGEVPEITETGSHQVPEQAMPLPTDAFVNGRTDGGSVDYYRFTAQAGQTLVVECLAQQIDSNLQPVVTIYDPTGNQLQRSRRLLDPVLKFTAPTDGEYLVSLHDHVYAGGVNHFYRLRIYRGPYIVATSPSTVQGGQTNHLKLFGANLPSGAASDELHLDTMSLDVASVAMFVPSRGSAENSVAITNPVASMTDSFPLQWNGSTGASNILHLGYADHTVVSEHEPNDLPSAAQSISVPSSVAGRFFPRRDQDWVQFDAQAGQEFQIRVTSHRLGHPTDPEVFVQRVVKQPDGSEQVAQVSTNDDFRPDGNRYRQGIRRALDISHRDPSVRFRADQDAIYRIGLRDLNGSSVDDPRLTYELVVEPLRPNFELLAWTQRPAAGDDKNIDRKPFTLRRAGRLSVMLDLTRWGGFEGPVQIEVKGLPSGVQAEACVVPAGRNEAVLTIHADNSTSPWVGPITIVGHADLNGTRESRNAHEAVLTSNTGNIEQARPAARLARQMMLSVIAAEMAPIEVALPSDPPASGIWETSLGATLSIPLKMVAHSELKSEVSLAAYGIPEKAKADPVTLKGDAPETSLALVLDSAEVKPGTYAMLLRGKAKTAYARNPEAIAASEKARNDFNQVVADLDAQIVAAAAAVANAKQISAERSEQLAAWQTLRSQSAEAFAAAQQQVTEATERLGTLQQQVSAVQGDQVAKLREIAAQVTTASENARTQIQSAQAAITSLESELGSLQSQSTAAATKLAELESTHQMLTQKKDRATEYVKQLDQQLEDSRKNFGPQDVDLYVDSPAITVLVHPTPTELMKSEPVELAIGGQAMAPIKINRRFGFNGPVTVSLASVAGTDKIAAETVTIGETESEGQLTVTAAPDTPSGTYQATLKLSMKFNNLDLSQEFPWTVTVK